MVQNLSYLKNDSLNPLYFIIDKIKGYTEEYSGNKYLTLVPTDDTY